MDRQINIFEDALEAPVSKYEGVSEDPLVMFNTILLHVKGTPVYDIFISVFQHLMLVRCHGKAGFYSWDIIDRVIQYIASMTDRDTIDQLKGLYFVM